VGMSSVSFTAGCVSVDTLLDLSCGQGDREESSLRRRDGTVNLLYTGVRRVI